MEKQSRARARALGRGTVISRRRFLAAIAWFACAPALADCGDLTKTLFGVEVRGQRNYLGNLPPGLVHFDFTRGSLTEGVDVVFGESQGMKFADIKIFWHEQRVVSVIAIAPRPATSAFQDDLAAISRIVGADFVYNDREDNYRWRCSDGLYVMARDSKVVRSAGDVPLSVLLVEDPKLKREMMIDVYCKDSTQHCPYRVQQK
jgi:hypothetical protein